MTAPTEVDYSQRAGHNPPPVGWVEPPDDADHEVFAALAATTHTFHADVSEFQKLYDNSYPYPMVAIRGDNGGRLDYNFASNHHRVTADPKNQVEVVYVVYRTDVSIGTVLNRLKTVLGATCPPKVAFRVDMESGSGFAGPGDHSSGANAWVAALTAYSRKPPYLRIDGYANGGDWSNNWRTRPNGLKRILADYSSSLPGGYFGYQYFGGMTQYPSPPGFPRSCPPFGAWVDMNVVMRPISQIVVDYGVALPAPPKPPTPVPVPIPIRRRDIAMMYRVTGAPAGTLSNCFLMRDSRIDLVPESATVFGFANALGQNIGADLGKLPPVTYGRHLQLGGPTLPTPMAAGESAPDPATTALVPD